MFFWNLGLNCAPIWRGKFWVSSFSKYEVDCFQPGGDDPLGQISGNLSIPSSSSRVHLTNK